MGHGTREDKTADMLFLEQGIVHICGHSTQCQYKVGHSGSWIQILIHILDLILRIQCYLTRDLVVTVASVPVVQ